ncbi:MAG: type I restriction enzyme HsdR N-terminal domain-containing protein [Bacteroidales bacterium]|nr:type I restriction enzyme HsdR N-terminal domain-containing protein [Bacteroidales bacterium]
MNLIWDPLRRKEVTATPEEQVRQWFILQLQEVFKVPLHMMKSEVGFKFGEKQYRADILVYDKELRPLAVVECKRPSVPLDATVVEQSMRYNSVLGVHYIILTNGNLTYLYKLKDGIFVPCDSVPDYNEMLCRQ